MRIDGGDSRIIPSDEWIADNHHIIEEAAEAAVNEKYPRSLYGRADISRAYEIASEIVGHTDGKVTETEITDFVSAYEKVRPLNEAELSVLKSMLRLALIERLSDICVSSDSIYRDRKECTRIFKEYMSYMPYSESSEREQKRSADILFENEEMLRPVFAETVLRLYAEREDNGGDAVREALSRRLAAKGTTVDAVIARAHEMRISLGVSAGNAVKSLQGLSSLDWDGMMSELCVTEQILNGDPAGIFGRMTPETRAEYVRLARVCARRRGETPEEFALYAASAAAEAAQRGASECECHVGRYIYDEYTKKNEFRPFRYMFAFITLILAFCPAVYAWRECIDGHSLIGVLPAAVITALILTVSMGLALTAAQNIFMERRMPFRLPALDFQGKLPEGLRIMTVIPCILSTEEHTDEIMREIEAAAWANPQEGIYYTVLADLPESDTRTRPEDARAQEYARKLTDSLNRRFMRIRGTDEELFHILIRGRVFYEKDKKWRGYERKRGALTELNRAVINGTLPRVDYVLTVDEGTVIPVNTAVSLAQIMHHPLNRPEVTYIGAEPVVTKGYAILQPAMSHSGLDRENATLFEKIYSDDSGYDSYQSRTSDFYFDICHEGIYTGKGMYDPYIFNGILEGRFKEDSILSHDLLEGSYLRTGFASGIHLYENFPKSLAGHSARLHRWLRGDWQLLPFMGRRFEDAKSAMRKNPLNAYSLFKMRMNILRGVMPCAALLLLFAGIYLVRRLTPMWVMITVIYAAATAGGGSVPVRLLRGFFNILFLPHAAYCHADAAVRALWRTYRSRKNMLEWVVSTDTGGRTCDSPSYYCRLMWPCFAAAAAAAPFMYGIPSVLWITAPFAAYIISHRPVSRGKRHAYVPDEISVRKMRFTARKIWAFYEDLAGKEENHLPPDNVQFSPVYSVAHRTSPTNIGFLIISVIISHRFGYISKAEMISRLSDITDTLCRTEKWNGHLLNWYDTTTLEPLEPRYVSSVDSGNLCACLLTAASYLSGGACGAEGKDRLFEEAEGMLDTVYCLNALADEDGKVDERPLEKLLSRDASENEFRAVIDHYRESLRERAGENAGAHSLRLALMRTAERLGKKLGGATECGNESALKETAFRMADLALKMDFGALYDKKRRQLRIGYNCSESRFSDSYYDMLMSEARLTSYAAMAKGDIGEEHFVSLARRWNGKGTMLLSWSGTVFEYMMPELFMPSPCGSALSVSVSEMLDTEIKGAPPDTPWGISESGYNVPDINMNYKYKAFGMKELAVKRIQGSEHVTAPYASLMSCAHRPLEVIKNMDLMAQKGALGRYGFYEALDDTPGRRGIVESFMAHHLGMSLCGIANTLFDGMISKAFSEMPMMRSIRVILTEKHAPHVKRAMRAKQRLHRRGRGQGEIGKNAPAPKAESEAALIYGRDAEVLSNGRYSAVLNGSGGGYSMLDGILLNVKRMGGECRGTVFYLNGKALSPVKCVHDSGKTEYTYYTGTADVTQTVCVFQNADAELRKIRITNNTENARLYNITAYTEIMLASQAAYEAHPSYSNMFVTTRARTDIAGMPLVLTAERRRHSPEEKRLTAYCALRNPDKDGKNTENVMYDTDILSFTGRNRSPEKPEVFEKDGAGEDVLLSMNTGTVLNPCFAVNAEVRVGAGESAEIELIFGMSAGGPEEACDVSEKLDESGRAFELARTRSIIENEHISLRKGDTAYFRSFSSKLLYGRKSCPEALRKKLWSFGISGDNPIITVMLRRTENAARLEKIVRMWCFYSFRGMKTDMVIAVFDNSDYMSPVRELAGSVASKAMWGYFTVRGDIFVIAPKDSESAVPLIESANVVFWL